MLSFKEAFRLSNSNLAMVPVMVHVDSTISLLKELKDDPTLKPVNGLRTIQVYSKSL